MDSTIRKMPIAEPLGLVKSIDPHSVGMSPQRIGILFSGDHQSVLTMLGVSQKPLKKKSSFPFQLCYVFIMHAECTLKGVEPG